ncbi:MAG: hypothetical protein EP329_03965 [Deltaproteobacteria bacterium]|nr:MAG: hypothetical protein EP329_03965 [Deltaproteobacteria bacterium]
MASTWRGLFFAAGLLVACEDETGTNGGDDTVVAQDTVTDDTATTDTATSDTAAPLETVRFQVRDFELGSAPVAGAQVTFGPPCASALKAVTDADGTVVFETALDWACGDASVRVAETDHQTVIITTLTEAEVAAAGPSGLILDAPRLSLTAYMASHGVMLDGGTQWFTDESHTLYVGTDDSPQYYQGTNAHWSVWVPGGSALRWVALELHQGGSPPLRGYDQIVDQAATGVLHSVPANVSMDINFEAQSIALERTQITFPPVPSTVSGLAAGTPYVLVFADANLVVGFSEHLGAETLNTEASGGVAWIPLDADAPQTLLKWGAGGYASGVTLDGFPTPGTQDVTFLRPPIVTSPDKLPADHPLVWTNPEPEQAVEVMVFASAGTTMGRGVARVVLPPGSTSVTLTELGIPDEVFTARTYAQVLLCDRDVEAGFCRRAAVSAPNIVSPAP